ncbi:MAG: NAD+ synthase [Phycisphaerae bacterium]|nr:NAD+ synthase [Phycisphaerae bacterium]
MKIALVQTNPTIGDIAGNTQAVLRGMRRAAAAGAELAVFPEQTLIGYPARDLLLRREVIERNLAALAELAAAATDVAVIVGYAEPSTRAFGRPLFNAAALLHRGQVLARWQKRLLPTYDVFDEVRYFEPGGLQPVVELGGLRLGVTICEDMWSREEMLGQPLYDCDPIQDLAAAGAQVVLNIAASPYFLGKHDLRFGLMAEHARRHRVPLLFVNQVGGNDELIFDGSSTVVDAGGRLVGQAAAFAEDLLLVELSNLPATRRALQPDGPASLHAALVLGLRDYLRKCGFHAALVGLSGGIDSAVVAVLAAEALGPQNVQGVAMPSRFSSDHSVTDARVLAENLGIQYAQIEIEPMHAAFERTLQPHFAGRPPDIAEENIQARTRGVILMALSNKFGRLLLTTGNKSELAVGYCTLYGDMAGGLAVISDVPKTMIYTLARYMNVRAGRPLIPEGTLTKPPSAELRPNQTDQDTLPPYEVLDEILERYEVRLQDADEIVAAGFERAVVTDVLRKIQLSEYKRRQAAPGLKVTSRAFGFGRRMPIAARYPQ